MIPGLAFNRFELCDLSELIGSSLHQRELTFFRQHENQILIGQQDDLAVTVSSAFPLALAVLQIDAGEAAAVEAKSKILVNDEVVEVRLQPDRSPALCRFPTVGSVCDREATHADLNNVSDARFPFLFLLGQTNLKREFRSITLAETGTETRTLRLVSRAASAGLREIFLEVYPDGRIIKVRLVDTAGAVSEVALSNVRENFIAPPDAFEFRPPPGVTVRRQK